MIKMEYNNNPYGNFKMISIDGNFLAYTDLKRMNWYLDRDLADKVDDKIYQLNFVTQGGGNETRAEFYKIPLENKCVVCGTDEELTKHHVVPSQYRKLLPIEYKGRNSFDIVSICDTCHNTYEREAEKLKAELLEYYGLTNYIREIIRIKRVHNILKNHSENYPMNEVDNMRIEIILYMNLPIEDILSIDKLEFENESTKLMGMVEDIDGFVIMWREHFLEVAEPQHIHQKWVDNIKII